MSDPGIFAAAARRVGAGQTVGLGTGRAAASFVRALGARVAQGLRVHGVATSRATAALAEELGIALRTMEQVERIHLAVDGADEVDGRRDLIKGHGGALVRERVVAAAADHFLILVGPEKLSARLGERQSVPVEVVPFAAHPVRRTLDSMGAQVAFRNGATDNGNRILTAQFGPIANPAALHRTLLEIPGVVDSGLFVGMADEVLVSG